MVSRVRVGLVLIAGAIGVWMLACSSSSDGTGGGGGGGMNNNSFDSGTLSNGQSFTKVFPVVGSVPYYCEFHGGPGGAGMSGVITVNAGGTPSKTNVSIVGTSLPDLTIDVGDTITWTNNAGMNHTVQSDD